MAHAPVLKVQVWIYTQNPSDRTYHFLLLKTRPERGGFWQPVTGGVDPGEALEVAALREAKEETGLAFLHTPVPLGRSFEFESRGKTVGEQGFHLKVQSLHSDLPPAVQLDPHEHVDSLWVSAEAAFQLLKYESNSQLLRKLVAQLQSVS